MNLAKVQELTKSVTAEGIHALDLLGERALGEDFAKVKTMIELSYGVKFETKDKTMTKIDVLFDLIAEEGWSKERLQATTKWVLKNKKWGTWTPADWFEYGVKLYPYSWYQKQIASGVKHEEMECYLVNGIVLWKMKDGQELPFERPEAKKTEEVAEPETDEAKLLDYPKLNIEDLLKVYDINTKAPVNDSNSTYNPTYSKGKMAYEKAKEEFDEQVKKELGA
jgi:hypothetical protein